MAERLGPAALAVLDQVDQFLSRGDGQAGALAAVLTALRGPDSSNGLAKSRGTNVVRRVAFPKTARSRANVGMDFACSGIAVDLDEARRQGERDHFVGHLRSAAEALGIPKKGQ
jgi:hypothetical protein